MNGKTIFVLSLLVVAAFMNLPLVLASQEEPDVGIIDANTPYIPNGSTFNIAAEPIVKNINGSNISMYSYNGRIPGPLIRVRQGSSIYVNLTNDLDMDTTVHWHGIRLNSSFDGVPGPAQKPIQPGESFLYKLDFHDDGIYWYHPHVRDDIGQEMGLYGNILVEPLNHTCNPVDKEVALFLGDIKIAGGQAYPFSRNLTDFALTGRFGNIMLINGQADYHLKVNKGEVVRFYLTDSSNTRTFNFSIENTTLKLIGGDSGRYERESFVSSVLMSVGERYIVEALFDKPGTFRILNSVPEEDRTKNNYVLGTVSVSDEESSSNRSQGFSVLKNNSDVMKELEPFKKYLSSEPDYRLNLTIHVLDPVLKSELDKMRGKAAEPIEWDESEDMAMMNSMATSKMVRWVIRDDATGKENPSYQVKVGDIKKIRIFNDPSSLHPMQHPIHLHGQRFLILARDGRANDNLVWKDTVLVPAGSTTDILVEFTNPGDWLMHCHIPEHAEAGMTASFNVSRYDLAGQSTSGKGNLSHNSTMNGLGQSSMMMMVQSCMAWMQSMKGSGNFRNATDPGSTAGMEPARCCRPRIMAV